MKWIVGQTHDGKGNVANYHTVRIWPCMVGGCSSNRLPIVAEIAGCATSSGGRTMTPVFIVGVRDRRLYVQKDVVPTIRSNCHGAIPHFLWIEPIR